MRLLGLVLGMALGIASPHAHAKSEAKPARQTSASAKSRPLPSKSSPALTSVAAVAIDAKTGEVVYAKNANKVRHIASTTKIFVAMAVRQKKMELDALTTITKEDASFAKGGSRTRLMVGHRFRNQDLLRAMLIASDNRAPTALGRAAGMTPKQLVSAMNRVAKKLGLKKTRFTDPSGLRGNTSTAKEMAVALGQAMKDPFLAEIMSTKDTTIRSIARVPHKIHYRNTNHSLHTGTYEVLGGKTGFTTPAGYCLLIEAVIDGRRLHLSFLGAKEKLSRFGDFGRVADWLKERSKS